MYVHEYAYACTYTSVDPLTRLQTILEHASQALVYSSESDRPFTFFFRPGPLPRPLTVEAFAQIASVDPSLVERRSLDEFLARHIELTDPYDVRVQQVRPLYEKLKDVLTEQLAEVCVFRVGRVEVHCFLVGRDPDGNLAGLETVAIET